MGLVRSLFRTLRRQRGGPLRQPALSAERLQELFAISHGFQVGELRADAAAGQPTAHGPNTARNWARRYVPLLNRYFAQKRWHRLLEAVATLIVHGSQLHMYVEAQREALADLTTPLLLVLGFVPSNDVDITGEVLTVLNGALPPDQQVARLHHLLAASFVRP